MRIRPCCILAPFPRFPTNGVLAAPADNASMQID
jgi:hypothetical protein